jgi:hypothetical protein
MAGPFFSPEDFFHKFLINLPLLLVWLSTGVLALVFWQRQPRVCLLILLAAGLQLFQAFLGLFLEEWLLDLEARRDWDPDVTDGYLLLLDVFRSLLNAAGWVLMLIAALGWRRQRPPMPYYEPAPRPAVAPPLQEPRRDYPPGSFRE